MSKHWLDEIFDDYDIYNSPIEAGLAGKSRIEAEQAILAKIDKDRIADINTLLKLMRKYREEYPDADYDDALGLVSGHKMRKELLDE